MKSSAVPTPGSPAHALMAAAATAPSVLNTQPWSFDVRDHTIDLYADTDRTVRHIDPIGRQLTISCGAALFNMRVTAAHLGRAIDVAPFPDPAKPRLLATVKVGPHVPTGSPDA